MTTIEVGKFYKDEQGRKIEVVAIRPPQVFGLTPDRKYRNLYEVYDAKLRLASENWTPWIDEPAIPWDSVPDWCQWWAVDEDECQVFYHEKPQIGRYEYLVNSGQGYLVVPQNLRIEYAGSWSESLRQRPGEEVK
jgi:hypothetical protein